MQAGQKVRYLAPLPAAGTRGENSKNKRADLETLTHATTCSKRNDHLHNSCIEMLMLVQFIFDELKKANHSSKKTLLYRKGDLQEIPSTKGLPQKVTSQKRVTSKCHIAKLLYVLILNFRNDKNHNNLRSFYCTLLNLLVVQIKYEHQNKSHCSYYIP